MIASSYKRTASLSEAEIDSDEMEMPLPLKMRVTRSNTKSPTHDIKKPFRK